MTTAKLSYSPASEHLMRRFSCIEGVTEENLRQSLQVACAREEPDTEAVDPRLLRVCREHLETLEHYHGKIRRGPGLVTICPICESEVAGAHSYIYGIASYREHNVWARQCTVCGWWCCQKEVVVEDEWAEEHATYPSILVGYDLSHIELPLDVLVDELNRMPRVLHDINPTRLETLVQEIMRGVYACEVQHVGRTADGGIDVLVFDSDVPIAVQVKRRQSPDRIEGVAILREFLGAMVTQGLKHGIFVSTARRYTRGASELLELVDQNAPCIERLELWDFDRLLEMDKLSGVSESSQPWLRLACYEQWRLRCNGQENSCLYL